jgi:antitoxin HicB
LIAANWRRIMLYKVPLILSPQPEGGFTVTSPVLPELLTEGDTAEEALENASDALDAVVEIYQDTGRKLPAGIEVAGDAGPIALEALVAAP